tara:strand:+ start:33072 stop:33515 length:444 start_codon:yes stop_codon:yes gene_type:complete
VVPWDFSKEAEQELETAFDLVDDLSMIRVVHVAPSDTSGAAMAGETVYSTIRRDLNSKFQQQISERFACPEVNFYVVHGRVAPEIVAFAQQYQAGLIVMGTREHWAVARLLRGSTTSEVLHTAPCPILILRHNRSAEYSQLRSLSAR